MPDKLNKLIERNKKVEILMINVRVTMVRVKDFDFMVDEIQQLISKTNVKLFTKELRSIANIYFNKNKTKEQLDLADKLFQEIDHANNMIVETEDSTIGLFYTEYQCDEWQKLILKSIEDLDNREIRIQILQHPFKCQHPTCIQVANHMKGILK